MSHKNFSLSGKMPFFEINLKLTWNVMLDLIELESN